MYAFGMIVLLGLAVLAVAASEGNLEPGGHDRTLRRQAGDRLGGSPLAGVGFAG